MSRIALVHERLTDIAGSEHVVSEMAEVWPSAKVHVPFSRPEGIPGNLSGRVRTSPLQKLYTRTGSTGYAPLLPAVPWALRHTGIDVRELDALVLSHHAFALGALHTLGSTDVPSIAYVHSPARWAWDKQFRQNEASTLPSQAALTALSQVALRNEKRWAPRVTKVIANSSEVKNRIERWWGRDAEVIHPPVDTEYFTHGSERKEDYFVAVGRLVPYKRVDLAAAAAVRAGVKLVIIGSGRDEARVRASAGQGVELRGHLPRDEVRDIVREARALIMPGVEDFGIVPVEAMAAGTPVIALGEGGALDTVRPGVSGHLVGKGGGLSDSEIIAALASTMQEFDDSRFNRAGLEKFAESFSRSTFRSKMQAVVSSVL